MTTTPLLTELTASSRLQSHYVRVSSFEAEMLVFLNKIRRNRKLVMVDHQPESSRFEELS